MEKIKININNKNLGIQLLRFFLCLWVVIYHCSNIKKGHRKYFYRGFHVPTFFMLSFYYFYPILSGRKVDKIIIKFQRLLIPYILWPTFILLLNNFLINFFHFGQFNNIIPLKNLYFQIIIGSPLHIVFWFHFNLIFLSLFFLLISFLFPKKLLILIYFIGITSLIFHVSQINYIFFNRFRNKFRNNLGSIIELIPLAALGVCYGSINLLQKVKHYPKYLKIIFFIFIIILFKYDIFIKMDGFRYPNVFLNIAASTFLILFFGSINFENRNKIYTFLNTVTNFTGGIYYLHPVVQGYISICLSLSNRKGTYFFAFIIYIICYGICLLGNKSMKNKKLKYLFI